MFYFFRHDKDQHVMTITDKNATFGPLPEPAAGLSVDHDAVGSRHAMGRRYDFRPGRWAQRDFNFETPSSDLTTNEKTMLKLRNAQTFERYDYPGRYLQKGRGTQLTRTLMQAEEAAHHAVSGASNYAGLDTGRQVHAGQPSWREAIVGLRDPPGAARGDRHQPPDPGPRRASHYDNSFEAIPFDVPFRPLRVTEKPVRPRPADRHRRRTTGREDPHRQVRPRARAIPLGPLRQARRQEFVLDSRVAVVGRSRMGIRAPSPRRT